MADKGETGERASNSLPLSSATSFLARICPVFRACSTKIPMRNLCWRVNPPHACTTCSSGSRGAPPCLPMVAHAKQSIACTVTTRPTDSVGFLVQSEQSSAQGKEPSRHGPRPPRAVYTLAGLAAWGWAAGARGNQQCSTRVHDPPGDAPVTHGADHGQEEKNFRSVGSADLRLWYDTPAS